MPRLANEQHEVFARAYASNGMQGTAAALLAGFAPGSAAKRASLLLKRSDVSARVRELVDTALKQADITADRTLLELARVGYSDIRSIFDEHGNLIPVRELPHDVAASIEGVDVVMTTEERVGADGQPVKVTTRTVKVRRGGKLAALRMLAQYHKILAPDPEDMVNAMLNYGDRLSRARARREQYRLSQGAAAKP